MLENFRAKHHNAQHLGQIPKAVTGAACPTLAQPQLTEMDSAEWNETHKAPCTPHQRLYQTEINGRQHSLRGTQAARTNTVSWGAGGCGEGGGVGWGGCESH